MPIGDVIEKLARAYMTIQRRKSGAEAAEREETAALDASALRKAQLAKIAQEMQLAPAHAAAVNRNLDEPNRMPPPTRAGTPHYSVDERGILHVTVPQDDGTFKTQALGPYAQRPADVRPDAAKPGGGDEGVAANPFNVTDAQGNIRLAVRDKHAPGGIRFVDKIGDTSVGPGPTADMRNVEFQAQAVEPAFNLVSQSLGTLKTALGEFGGSVKGMVPGTLAYNAKSRFQEQAKALLGAIVARQAGEGSRLSDEDRRAYSQAATLVNNLILLPGGIEEAEGRLADAKGLLDQVMSRRRGGGVVTPGGMPTAPPAGAGGGAPVEFVRDSSGRLVRRR